jgi:CheY-like chemotaxis protein
MSYVLAIEPHREQARVLRDEIRARTRTKLTVVESLDAALEAIDAEVPALVLVDALMPAQDEHSLVARLKKLPPSKTPQVLFLPALARHGTAPASQKWSFFGFSPAKLLRFSRPKGFKPVDCDPATFALHVCEYLGDPDRAGRDRREALRIEQVDWATLLVDGVTVDLIDLSATGAQVRSTVSLQPGGVVQILLKTESEEITCEAGVVWGTTDGGEPAKSGYRAGVAFKDADKKKLERLYSKRVRHDAALATPGKER